MIAHRSASWIKRVAIACAAVAGLSLFAPAAQAQHGENIAAHVKRNHYLRATGQPVGPIDNAIYGSPYRGVGVPGGIHGHGCCPPCVGPRCTYPYYTLRRPLDFMYRCGDGYGGAMDW
ncbi:MAG TPA: hypothetical protein VGE52_15785 [Pirellulales bacterium]